MTKIKKFYVVCFLCFIHVSLSAQLVPYRAGDLWGYSDANGNIVVPVQFDEAYPFVSRLEMLEPNYNVEYDQRSWPKLKNPVAVFKKNGLYGLLDSKGQMLSAPVSPAFFQFEPAIGQTYWVRYNDGSRNQEGSEVLKSAYLYDDGAKLTPFQYEYIVDEYGEDGSYGWSSYLSFVRAATPGNLVIYKNGKAGTLSINGEEIIPPIWDIAQPGDDGYTVVFSASEKVMMNGYSGTGYYLIAPGNRIIKKIENVEYCSGSVASGLWAMHDQQRIWLMNSKGEKAAPDYFSEFIGFNEDGFAEVRDSTGNWRIINTKCETVLDLEFEGQCLKDTQGYWKREKDNLWYRYNNHFQKTDNKGYLSPFTQITLSGKNYWMYNSKDSRWGIKNHPEIKHTFDFKVFDTWYNYPDELGRKFDLQLVRIEKNGKFGIADCQLRELMPPQFQYFTLLYGPNIWKVGDADKIGVYDMSKKQLILPVEFDEIKLNTAQAKPLLTVRQNKYWGQYDLNGKEILPVIFERNPGPFSRLNLVKSKKGWHVLDENLKEISAFTLPPHDENPNSPSLSKLTLAGNEILVVFLTIKGKKALLNQWGQMLIPPDYDDFKIEGDYIIAQKEGKFGVLLYPELCEFIPFKYENIYYLHGKFKLFKGKNFNEYLYYDPLSHKKIAVQSSKYTLIGSFEEGLIVAMKDCKYGFLDELFNVVIPLNYANARDFSGGLAAVQDQNTKLWGFINNQGEEIIRPKYNELESFHNGKSLVKVYGLQDSSYWSAVIDRSGRELIKAPGLSRNGQFIIVYKDNNVISVLDSNLQTVISQCSIMNKNEQEGYIYYLENGQPWFLSADGTKKPADFKVFTYEYPNGLVSINFYSANGLQDKKGRWLIPLMTQWMQSYDDGETFVIQRDEKIGLFDRNGNQLILFQDANLELKGNFYEANYNGLLGLFDLNGKLIVPVNFSAIEVLPKLELTKVITPENKVGFFDFKGRQYFKD
jgi:hypothetical protein